MSDITKCSGLGCPIKHQCKRFTAKSGSWQSFFTSPPFEQKGNEFKCEYYWGETQENIFGQLKAIVK